MSDASVLHSSRTPQHRTVLFVRVLVQAGWRDGHHSPPGGTRPRRRRTESTGYGAFQRDLPCRPLRCVVVISVDPSTHPLTRWVHSRARGPVRPDAPDRRWSRTPRHPTDWKTRPRRFGLPVRSSVSSLARCSCGVGPRGRSPRGFAKGGNKLRNPQRSFEGDDDVRFLPVRRLSSSPLVRVVTFAQISPTPFLLDWVPSCLRREVGSGRFRAAPGRRALHPAGPDSGHLTGAPRGFVGKLISRAG